MWKEFILLSVIAVTLTSSLKVQCKHDSECGTDECCFYHEGPMIMSKRQDLVSFAGMVQGGWCEKYQPQGEYCSSIGKMNGHCGCAPGLKCKWIPDPTLSILLQPVIHARSMQIGGHSECQP
ncbi:U3-aranetoxin-Ce1a-like [Mytilus californianus]|uniref:U3-aranetoxin-Ce1a-like n=1 Tax=Mytilus californianus TaxID=6549 RepID=UPI002245DA78|nr:U3-aranetoxin-Ce1a-like [Mytilus californianus]